ncbi:hypothetical protein Tco_0903530 [Tanacetum coccineum]
MLKACFPEFDKVVKDRTTPSYITNGEWHFEHTKKCFVEEIIPFYEKLKTHVKGIEDNLFKEVSEYMKIFDELDKENLELETEILKVCFEINKLKDQLQGKDELLRKLKAQIDNMNEVIANPNLSTLEFQALETENTQLKEELTAVRIKNASLRDENVSIKKRYQDLYQSKAESNSNVSSRAAVPEKPKVLAPGLYAMTPKYVPPQKRNNREANTPLPRKETVSLVKKTNVCVNLSTGIKSVTEASKSKSKCETKTHRNLPARSENVKRVDNPLRSLNKRNRVDSSLSVKRTGFISNFVSVCNICNECLVFGNHNKCGVKNLNSVNAKNPKVKNDAIVKQVWKATGKIFASIGSKWKPTGRKFTLGDTCPLTRITKPEVVPLEKSGSVSTSKPANNVIVTPRFSNKPLTSYKRKDGKLKDTSTGSPHNAETKAVNDPVNVNDLSVNQQDPNKIRYPMSQILQHPQFSNAGRIDRPLCVSLWTSGLENSKHTGIWYSIRTVINDPYRIGVDINDSVNVNENVNSMEMCNKCLKLKVELFKQHNMVEKDEDKNNRETHIYYLKHTMEQAVILRKIVEQAKSLNPLDSVSYTAYKYVKLIQELLGYVRDTCPDIHKPSNKLVTVTPINKKKIVRFAKPVASLSNIPKVTNRPLLYSTRVKPSTSASGSKPLGNTKNDRISRPPSSNEKNKVEVQSRKVKSSLNKKNSDSKNVCNKHVKHPVKGAKAPCSICNECLFDANHAMCLIDYVNSMNVRAKSASKKNKKRKAWKPTGKVFNSVG